jgi:hypothetical protein
MDPESLFIKMEIHMKENIWMTLSTGKEPSSNMHNYKIVKYTDLLLIY